MAAPAFRTHPVRVMVVDDHPIVREGLALLFQHKDDMEVCGEADSADQALQQLETIHPDVMIVDLTLKDSNGLDLIKQIKGLYPDLPVLVLSVHDESVYAERVLRAGARGYIMKEELTEKVVTAIRHILNGKVYLSERMSEKFLNKLTGVHSNSALSPIEQLSDRELDVFQMLGKGYSTNEIAQNLYVSPKTVQSYRTRIKNKLQIETSTDLLKFALEWTKNQSK